MPLPAGEIRGRAEDDGHEDSPERGIHARSGMSGGGHLGERRRERDTQRGSVRAYVKPDAKA